ncbi:hypothetical protein L1987_01958 [Smallanthus sonchifolius]|uniref:Uncharacterized protein n=1 Tax=Smallanthus sonchifolius TaxID=185202 RepID=A0ACB9K6Q1_9ASTR|nr:hypothetical protein L1987_01958 [Smallanthus sonchifolius]
MSGALNWPMDISSDHLMPEGPVEEVDGIEINSYITIIEQGGVRESPRNLGEFDPNDWRFTPSPQMVPPLLEPHGEETSRPRIQEQPANPDIVEYFNNNDNEVDYKKVFTVCLENEVKMG